MPNHTNQLLDKVEELLIENRALGSALEVVKRLLPPAAQEKVRAHIEEIKSDPTLRELERRRFAQYRDQSESAFSQLLEEDFKKQSPRAGVEAIGRAVDGDQLKPDSRERRQPQAAKAAGITNARV